MDKSDCHFAEIELNPITNEIYCTYCFNICDVITVPGKRQENYAN